MVVLRAPAFEGTPGEGHWMGHHAPHQVGVVNVDVASGSYNGFSISSGAAPAGLSITGGFNSSTWLPSASATTVSGTTQAILVDGVTGVGLSNLTLQAFPAGASGP